MPSININDAQAWAEGTKLALSSIDVGLEAQVATQVLSRIAQAYDVSGWTTPTLTPGVVRSIVAMTYVSWLYSRTYSEDEPGSNEYAIRLLGMAEDLITGIINGVIDIVEVVTPTLTGTSPSFYPNDLSSAQDPTPEDPSLGGAKFTLGAIF